MTRTFGIREARNAATMSQDHLARAAGVSRRTVVRAEAGAAVSAENLRCLRAALGLPGPSVTGGDLPDLPPREILIGWREGPHDVASALDEAARFALRVLDPLDGLWAGTLPFREGHLFEVHAGGSGLGHLPAVIEALTAGRPAWLPSGRRVCQLGMEKGTPRFLTLPPGTETDLSRTQPPLRATLPLRQVRTPFSLAA